VIKVLCVDDSSIDLEFISEALRIHNIETVTVQDPHEAVAIAKQCKPDMVLLDLLMADMSGIELCKQFKTDPDTANLPIMFLTADQTNESLVQGVHLGVMDYIHKPINRAELASTIIAQNAALQLKQLFNPLKVKSREYMDKYSDNNRTA
jgi:CheY-like chemotaxis protein